MLARREHSLLADLAAPSPERLARTLELIFKVAIVVVVSMTFQIPDPALSAYIVFFVSKEDSGRSILISVVFVIAILITVGFIFLLVPLSLDHPSLRILFIAATSFALFFLGRASKLEPLASTLGLIIATGLNVEQKAPIGELATRGLLYVLLFAIFPILVNIAVNVACGRHPDRLLRDGLARRLLAVAVSARGGGDRRLQGLITEGNAELLAELKMASLFHHLSKETAARLKAFVTVSYALLLSAAVQGATQAVAVRLERLADAIRYASEPTETVVAPVEGDESDQVGSLAAALEAIFTEKSMPHAGPVPAAEPKGGFFKPDAFSNPAYERFAAKATAAVMVCYLTFNILDWSGISTCMITCFIVALSTVGESAQKMTLRLVGCAFGAAFGYIAIIFVLPMTTQITGLVLVVAVITLPAAWIAFGSPRVSYIGFQIAFAAYLCTLQGLEPKFDLTIARDRFIGILFGNVTVFVIFTGVYATSLLPGLIRDLESILAAARAIMDSIAERKPPLAIGEQIAHLQTLVRKIDGEIVAYGFEKRPSRLGRLHVFACRLIDKALHDVVADVVTLSNAFSADVSPEALQSECEAASRRFDALAEALRERRPLKTDGSGGALAGVAGFDRLHRHLDSLTVTVGRYRRNLGEHGYA